ncbi:hypothetical protein D3C87_1401020 [compost metagenome]
MIPRHTQLELDRSYAPLVQKLIDHDSGAALVIIDLLRTGRKIGAPVGDNAAWCLKTLDTLGVHGPDLYVLWGSLCDHSADQMVKVLRACCEQRCGLSCDLLTQAIACCNQGGTLDRRLQMILKVPGL